MLRGLIFDVDGTLVTFTFDIKGAKTAMITELISMGLDTTGLSVSSSMLEILEAARSQAEGRGMGHDFRVVKKQLYSILDSSEMETGAAAEVIPRIRETLEYLRSKSVRLAVVTNSGRRPALERLTRSGLLDLFDFVLTRDDVETMKPSPAGVEKAVALLSLPKGDVYYVGDSLMDIQAAKRAGLKVISVATGNYTMERLKDEGSDCVLETLAELPGFLKL